MPVNLSRIMKLGTPKMDLAPGAYPAHIVAVVYPKEPNGTCRRTFGEFLLQVHKGDGVCYVPTKLFDISINEQSPMFHLLSGLTGTHSSMELFKWLKKKNMLGEDEFDETNFLGSPVLAQVDRFTRNSEKHPGTYNVVTGFAPLASHLEPNLVTDRLIPYSFAKFDKFVIEKLPELDIDNG